MQEILVFCCTNIYYVDIEESDIYNLLKRRLGQILNHSKGKGSGRHSLFITRGGHLEIRQLQHFIETYKYNSFAQAAENCYITAQGISMSISRLEEELGLKLFMRTPKGLFPTKEGEYLLPKAEQIIKIVGDCEAHFTRESERDQRVSVMFVRGTVEKFAVSSIAQFKEKHPEITVHVQVGADLDCDNAVENGEVDMALRAGPVDLHKFSATLIYSGKNVLVVNKSNPLSQKGSVSIEDLKDVPLALQQKTTKSTNMLFSLCKKAGFEPNAFTYVDDPRLAIYLAGLNLCCGITTLTSAQKICGPELCIVPFDCDEMNWNIYLIKKKDAVLSQGAKTFEKILLKYREE